MGELAARFFRDAEALGGPAARVQLASLAGVSSARAASEPDTPARLEDLALAFAGLLAARIDWAASPKLRATLPDRVAARRRCFRP